MKYLLLIFSSLMALHSQADPIRLNPDKIITNGGEQGCPYGFSEVVKHENDMGVLTYLECVTPVMKCPEPTGEYPALGGQAWAETSLVDESDYFFRFRFSCTYYQISG